MSVNATSRQLVDEIIKYLAAGGNITLDIKRPNFAPHLSLGLKQKLNRVTAPILFRRMVRYLRQQNLVSIHHQPQGKIRLRLAAGGIKRAQKITLNELTIPRPSRWDQRWRLVVFDIPETKRQARNKLSQKLRALGFQPLQKSVWIHPFPCLIEIEYIKQAYGVTAYVTLAEISKIDQQSQLLRRFRSLLQPVPKRIT